MNVSTSSPWEMWYLCTPFLYAFIVSVVSSREIFISHTVARFHNGLLSIFSLGVALTVMYRWWEEQRFPSACARPSVSWEHLCTVWYLSKIWEWGDTIILIARRRPVQRLHYWHHMLTPLLVRLQTVGRDRQTPGWEIATCLNATVHAWMYLYYLYPAKLRSTKRVLTMCQLGQHIVVLGCLIYAGSTTCDVDVTYNIAPLVMYSFFAYQFFKLLFPV